MHELSLVHALLEQVHALMRQQAAERVVSIRISVGEFSGVEADLFRDAYDMLVDTTPMRGAELQIERVPLEARCGRCESQFIVPRFRFVCPACGCRELAVVRGEELILESVTMDSPYDSPDRDTATRSQHGFTDRSMTRESNHDSANH